jgi:peptide deformylase
MARILPLVYSPDPLLKEISKPVEKFDQELKDLIANMILTMYAHEGIGLAGVQVGVLKRVLVMDLDYEEDEDAKFNHSNNHHDHQHGCNHVFVKNNNPKSFINPEIIESSSDTTGYKEGCLSFPEARSEVIRPKKVIVKYFDENGNEKLETMEGLMSVCIQHEIDHLNGVTFVDRISKVKREMIIKKMKKFYKN